MYNYLLGKSVDDIPKNINNKKIIIKLSQDKQITDFNSELVVRIKEEENKIILTTAYFLF